MKAKDIYLTFKTDEVTAYWLKTIAKTLKKTQPELINDICKDFIEDLDKQCEEKLREDGLTTEQIYPMR